MDAAEIRCTTVSRTQHCVRFHWSRRGAPLPIHIAFLYLFLNMFGFGFHFVTLYYRGWQVISCGRCWNLKYRNVSVQAGKHPIDKLLTGYGPKKNWPLSLFGLTWAGRVTADLVDGTRFPTAVFLFPNERSCEPNSTSRVLPLASARCPPFPH